MKILLRIEELYEALFALFVFAHLPYAWWVLPAAFPLPDLRMAGYLAGPRVGAYCYNVVHHKALAFAVGVAGWWLVEVSARRTGADYCRFLQRLAAHYPQAEKIALVQDNLNTHTDAVFYQHLPAAQARALAARFELHYTPKNASWLNMVELKLSAIARQCLHQRIPTLDELTAHVAACVAERNAARATVKWQFTLERARVKLDRHYQKIRAINLPD